MLFKLDENLGVRGLKQLREAGMMTLRENGWRKVLWGVTSVDEIVRMARHD